MAIRPIDRTKMLMSLFQPEESTISTYPAAPSYVPDTEKRCLGIMKAVFWIVVAIGSSFLISNL